MLTLLRLDPRRAQVVRVSTPLSTATRAAPLRPAGLCRRAPLTAPLSLVVQGGGVWINGYNTVASVTITGTSIYANAAGILVRHSPAPPTRCPLPR